MPSCIRPKKGTIVSFPDNTSCRLPCGGICLRLRAKTLCEVSYFCLVEILYSYADMLAGCCFINPGIPCMERLYGAFIHRPHCRDNAETFTNSKKTFLDFTSNNYPLPGAFEKGYYFARSDNLLLRYMRNQVSGNSLNIIYHLVNNIIKSDLDFVLP